MAIIGTTFGKIVAERKKGFVPNTKIETRPSIKEVKRTEISGLGPNVEALEIEFGLESAFEPDVGNINIEGSILYATEDAKKLESSWKKDKNLPDVMKVELLNHILKKASVQALMLSDTLQLPPIVRLPSVKLAENAPEEKKAKKK